MRFKVDENLPPDVADVLRRAGCDAHTVHDEALNGTDDVDVFKQAQAEARVLLTLDLGFGDARRYGTAPHAGIIVLRLASQSKSMVIRAVESLLPVLAAEPVNGRLWIADEHRIRVR